MKRLNVKKDLIAILFVLFTGTVSIINCTSNFIIKRSNDGVNNNKRDTIFVENTEQSFEYSILLRSNIFYITDDSTIAKHLILWPINERTVNCATPIFFTFLTLGIIPGTLPYQYNFGFVLNENGSACTTKISIDGGIRISFWDLFAKPFLKKEKVIGKGLREQYLTNNFGWYKQPYMHDVESK